MKEKREINPALSIVFGSACDARDAYNKLKYADVGSFLIRESSIEGLITVSIRTPEKNKDEEVVHCRYSVKSTGDGGIKWEHASPDAVEAKAQAASAKNAMKQIKDNPHTINGLIDLLEKDQLDLRKIIGPATIEEASTGYSVYSQNSYHSELNILQHDKKNNQGYGSE